MRKATVAILLLFAVLLAIFSWAAYGVGWSLRSSRQAPIVEYREVHFGVGGQAGRVLTIDSADQVNIQRTPVEAGVPPIVHAGGENEPDCGHPTVLTAVCAEKLIENLPEVIALASEISQHEGVNPIIMTESEPDPHAKPGTEADSYRIYFGEDHKTHVVRVLTFAVDPQTRQIFVYDDSQSKLISLEEWRKRKKASASFVQEPAYVEELKQPGDPVRVLVTFHSSTPITGGVAIFQREGREGECHLPQVVPLKGEIACTKVEKLTSTQYLFSGVVENNATGWYELTKIAAQSGDKEEQYLWGRDFHDIVRVLVRNPQEKFCVGTQE